MHGKKRDFSLIGTDDDGDDQGGNTQTLDNGGGRGVGGSGSK